MLQQPGPQPRAAEQSPAPQLLQQSTPVKREPSQTTELQLNLGDLLYRSDGG